MKKRSFLVGSVTLLAVTGLVLTLNVKPVEASEKMHQIYMTGYTDGTFKPNNYITRGEITAVFAKLSKNFDMYVNYPHTFTDVDNASWNVKYIGFCQRTGILDDGTGLFRPNDNLTKIELAVAISRYLQLDITNKTSELSDVKETAYEPIIGALQERGIINGREDGTFGIYSNVTRGEVCKIMNAAFDRSANVERIKRQSERSKLTDIEQSWAYYEILEATLLHKEDQCH